MNELLEKLEIKAFRNRIVSMLDTENFNEFISILTEMANLMQTVDKVQGPEYKLISKYFPKYFETMHDILINPINKVKKWEGFDKMLIIKAMDNICIALIYPFSAVKNVEKKREHLDFIKSFIHWTDNIYLVFD